MKRNIDVIFLGDSLTFGYGVKKEYSWVNKLVTECNFNAINKGINGDTTASMLSRLDADILTHTPKTVFIMGGSNDILLGRSISYILANIELIIKDCLLINSKVIVGIPPHIFPDTSCDFLDYPLDSDKLINNLSHFKNALIELCNKLNIKFIDFYTITSNKSELYTDGIHLNQTGNELMFKTALPYFKH